MSARLARIDVLRGLAVTLVLGRHIPVRGMYAGDPFLFPLCVWQRIGWTGVDLFFILSGFLVSGLLFREYISRGTVSLSRFFIRRALRIYVPFYAFFFLSLVFVWDKIMDAPFLFWVEALFVQSYFVPDALWNHTWSLAVEEHFYLLLGFLTFVLLKQKDSKDPFRSFGFLWPILAVFCLLLRIGSPYDSVRTMTNSHLRFDGLFFGVLLSYLYHFHRAGFMGAVERFRVLIGLLSVSCLVPAFAAEPGTEPWMLRFGITFLYLGFGGLLTLCLLGAENKVPLKSRAAKFLARAGVLSYSIYLWHMPAREVVADTVRAMNPSESSVLLVWGVVLVYLLLAVLGGLLSHRFIEEPSLAWRDRKFPAR